MTKLRLLASAFCVLLAIGASVFTIKLCIHADASQPVIVSDTELPEERVAEFFDCIVGGDYTTAEEIIGIGASLGLDTEPHDSIGKLVFDALRQSFSYELVGECSVSGVSAAQRVVITYLNIPAVIAAQKEPTKLRLEQYVEEAELSSEVFDESGAFRYEVAIRALYEVTEEILENAYSYYVTDEIEISLTYTGDGWYLQPSEELFRILSGNTSYR